MWVIRAETHEMHVRKSSREHSYQTGTGAMSAMVKLVYLGLNGLFAVIS